MHRVTNIKVGNNRRELATHGNLEFPCKQYHTSLLVGPKEYVTWHWHEELEIICVKEGNLDVHIPNQSISLKEGDCMFINASVLHEMSTEDTCQFHSLVFHPEFITGSKDLIFHQKYMRAFTKYQDLPVQVWSDIDDKAASIKDYFWSAYHSINLENGGAEFIVREYLTRIFIHLIQEHEVKMKQSVPEKNLSSVRIKNMLDYIHSHYTKPLTLAMIAKSGKIGERECLRCFSQTLQISPMQYVMKYRLTRGATLLKEQHMSITEISTLCGFDSPSYFSQLFKRHYRCTPKEYRNS